MALINYRTFDDEEEMVMNADKERLQTICSNDKVKTLLIHTEQLKRNEVLQLPAKLESLTMDNCVLPQMNFPQTLKRLNLSRGMLEKIDVSFSTLSSLETLCLSDNWIQKLENLPPNLTELIIWNNGIRKLENLPKTLEKLNIGVGFINSLENLPKNLQDLQMEDSLIKVIENLPPKLKVLNLGRNAISEIGDLPVSLERLYLDHSNVTYIHKLPPFLKVLDISGRRHVTIKSLPDKLEELYVEWCTLDNINSLPGSMRHLIGNNDTVVLQKYIDVFEYLKTKNIVYLDVLSNWHIIGEQQMKFKEQMLNVSRIERLKHHIKNRYRYNPYTRLGKKYLTELASKMTSELENDVDFA